METQKNIDRLLDVEMNVTVRFGKTELPLREVVGFGVGSMLELNRTVDEPVELLVNNYPFARGEVVVVDGYYGVRVTEIGSADERSKSLFPLPIQFGDETVGEPSTVPASDDDEEVALAPEDEPAVSGNDGAEPDADDSQESTNESMEEES